MAKHKKKPDEPAPVRIKKWRPPKPLMFDWSKYDPATTPGATMLVDEMVTYRDRLEELLENEGKFVLIKGREVVGIYETREEAIHQAVERFRDAPVFIKRIARKEPMIQFGGVVF